MTLILVEHDAPQPALYGALAAAVAEERDAAFNHLPVAFDTAAYADAVQHVTADGALVASGLLWRERLGGDGARDADLGDLLRRARTSDVAVPLRMATSDDRAAGDAVEARAREASLAVERLRVVGIDRGFALLDAASGAPASGLGLWSRDRFGRLTPAGAAEPSRSGPSLRIALIGAETDHRDVYPAGLAALADAADAAGFALDVTFAPPPALTDAAIDDLLHEVDGVLLPGGADMINVPGQIRVAAGALRARVPTAGLCLGMQTMTTAVVQTIPGLACASLAEADPDAPVKTFIPMGGDDGAPVHRLGDRRISIASGSRLAGLLGAETVLRCNHRFRLNPVLFEALGLAGLAVTAHDGAGEIADAVELAGHPFYAGMQGHPELSSRPGHAHPFLRSFLEACGRRLK